MLQYFSPKPDYQWVRYKISLELKYLHLLFRLYANDALFKYSDYWHTIELRAPYFLYFNIYLPASKQESCKRDLCEQIVNVQLEYNSRHTLKDSFPEENVMNLTASENDGAGIVTLIPMADIPFECKMSGCIIDCLKSETIDQDSIFGLGVYFHLLLIKYASSILSFENEVTRGNFYSIYLNEKNLDKKLAKQKYNENQKVLKQIKLEVFDSEETTTDSWIYPIRQLYAAEMHCRRFASNSLDYQNFRIWRYPDRINLILGLGNEDVSLLYYFIRKTLNVSL